MFDTTQKKIKMWFGKIHLPQTIEPLIFFC